METTFMPFPMCNMSVMGDQFFHPDQEIARKFAKRPKKDALLGLLAGGIVMTWFGLIWISYRFFTPRITQAQIPLRQGQVRPPGPGLIRRVLKSSLPYLFFMGGLAMIGSAMSFMVLENNILKDDRIKRDCLRNPV